MPAAYDVRRDDVNNMWTFRLDCMEGVMATLRAAEPSLTIVTVPKRVQDAFRPGKSQALLAMVLGLTDAVWTACNGAHHAAGTVRRDVSPAEPRLVQDVHGWLHTP
jgi:hypothetical protein